MDRVKASDDSYDFQPDLPKLESLAEFAAGIGHELNNPLAVINGRVQLLMRQTENAQTLRDLAEIQAAAFRAAEMIADIRLFACPPEPVFRKSDISALLNRLPQTFQTDLRNRSISLTITGIPQTAEILADPDQLSILFQALVRNSIEAIGERGAIIVSLRSPEKPHPDRWEILFQDNGPGLTPYEAEHAFDPYFSARQANRGLGFGLCKAYRIAQSHQGSLRIQSRPGQGAAVSVFLPIKQDD